MPTNCHSMRIALAAGAVFLIVGCENLPGTREEQATGVGATAGAAIGAAMSDNALAGALLGGAAGAVGGNLIGARTDWFEGDRETRSSEAREALERAEQSPASAADVEDSRTADLNDDGFVTMDELLAMEEAGLREGEIIDRLERTDQVFDLDSEQQETLMDAGFSRRLVAEIEEINREERERLLGQSSEVISRERS